MRAEYQIYRANKEERKNIIDFYSREWKKSQTINDEVLFDYYYVDGERLNFVVAKRDEEIAGACGFVRNDSKDIGLSNLLVRKGEDPVLVFRILNFLEEEGFSLYCVNITKEVMGIYRFYGYEVGKLKHYYKLFDRKEYKVAAIGKKEMYHSDTNQYSVIRLSTEQMFKEKIKDTIFHYQRPKKSCEYVIKRYYCFPYSQYTYQVWGIEREKDDISTIFVTREQCVGGQKILRMVDIIGSEEEMEGIGRFFENLGRDNGYEYIDCLCYGIKDEILKKMGFICCEDDINIIPDRLDPLEQCNTEIYFFNGNMPDFRAFRADGDNDRPNIWSGK